MKKFLSMILALTICLSAAACGGNNEKQKTLSSKDIAGTWKYDFKNSENNAWEVVEIMELFTSGTGKGTNSSLTNGSFYPLKWKIKDNVLIVSFEADPLSCAFEVEKDSIISTDGKLIYNKE